MPYGLLREVLRGTILDVAQHQPQESLNAMIQEVVPEAAGSDVSFCGKSADYFSTVPIGFAASCEMHVTKPVPG